MDEIRELLQRLSAADRRGAGGSRGSKVTTTFDELDVETRRTRQTAVLVELADIGDQVLAESATREQKATEAARAA